MNFTNVLLPQRSTQSTKLFNNQTKMSPVVYASLSPGSKSRTGSSLNQSQKVKPFCKICYDSGKPESMYNSHFVRESRDVNSRVVCPTLLALQCRFCGVRGHTVSKCKKACSTKASQRCLAEPCYAAPVKAPEDSYQKNSRFSYRKAAQMVKKNLAGAFDALSEDSDEEDAASDLSTVFPDLDCDPCPCGTSPTASPSLASQSNVSYASILLLASQSVPMPCLQVKSRSEAYYDCATSVSTENTLPTTSSRLSVAQRLKMGESWADISDSDEE